MGTLLVKRTMKQEVRGNGVGDHLKARGWWNGVHDRVYREA
jgi:hypothetical protein